MAQKNEAKSLLTRGEIWTRGGKAIVTEQLCEHESGMCKMSNLWLSHDHVYSLSLKTKWILKSMKVRL